MSSVGSPAVLGAARFSELIATTLEKIEPTLVDQIFTKHPALDIFKQNVKSYAGRSLVLNIETREGEGTVVTDNSGTFNLDRSPEIVGAAEYFWSQPYVTKVRIDWKTLQKNSGKEAIVDLVTAYIENAKKGHAKRLVEGLHKAGSAVTANEFNSLDLLVGNSDVNPTVGAITAVDANHFWNSTRLTIPVESEPGGMTIRKAFRTMRNELLVKTGNDAEVTHIIAGRKIFEEFEDSFDDKIRYVDFEKGQTRFRGIYDGDIEVRLDPDCPEDRAYFIDVHTFRFGTLNGNFMKAQPSQVITGTLDTVTPLASVLSVGVNSRRCNGLLVRTGGLYDES
jgi:hypothetical protein